MTVAAIAAGEQDADFAVSRLRLRNALEEPLVFEYGKARTAAEADLREALGLST